MIIKRVEVIGLLGRREPLSYTFHEDVNIATGKNGAGKTTLLKLVWYIISGNINLALLEIEFQRVILWTSEYKVTVQKISENTCRAEFEADGESITLEDQYDDDNDVHFDARDMLKERIEDRGKSLFFPTFRRIEGGFTIRNRRTGSSSALFNASRAKSELQEAMIAISRRLSNSEHSFVTSVSTVDIAELLLKRYTEMSEEANSLQRDMSQNVIDRIKEFKRESYEEAAEQKDAIEAVSVLDNIRTLIESADRDRNNIMAPWRAVQSLAGKLLEHEGIQVNNRISFGDAARSIDSDTLSAGEKQMLSFICYNALTENSIIFIDEPELSLHVDWQRILFPTLLAQRRKNQFIVATHSPFIYGKYPEREMRLIDNRGVSDEASL